LEFLRFAAGIQCRLRDFNDERPPTHVALVPGSARTVARAMEAAAPGLKVWVEQAAAVADAEAAVTTAKGAEIPPSIVLELEQELRDRRDGLEKTPFPQTLKKMPYTEPSADIIELLKSYAAICELAAEDPFPKR
jgi:hypothetical protein